MSKVKSLEKYRQALFDPDGDIALSRSDKEKVIRYREIYSIWINDPSLSRAQMRNYLKTVYPHLSTSQIYRDLNDIYILLGNVQNASRSHIQFVVNETLLNVINTLQEDPVKNAKNLIQAVDKLAKYNLLHQEAAEPVDWSQMVDFSIEPTSDPSTLGIEPVENLEELKSKLYNKYAEDIEFEEIKTNSNGSTT